MHTTPEQEQSRRHEFEFQMEAEKEIMRLHSEFEVYERSGARESGIGFSEFRRIKASEPKGENR